MKDNVIESVRKLGCLLGLAMPESDEDVLKADIFNSISRSVKKSWTDLNSTNVRLEDEIVEIQNSLNNLLKDYEYLKKSLHSKLGSEISIEELYDRGIMCSNAKKAKELLKKINK